MCRARLLSSKSEANPFSFSLSSATMVAANLKAATMALMDARASTEAEMNVIIESLCRPSCPGLSGNLVDSEGFPRSDIDVHAVRSQRNRLVVLRNDHTDIMDKIDKNLQVLHSVRLTTAAPLPLQSSGMLTTDPESTTQVSTRRDDSFIGIPFATIDEIAEDSPAAEDGLQLGDEIMKFGNVEIGGELQGRLISEAQLNQGKAVPLIIIKQGSIIRLSVTPRPWSGRGLLGCHFRIL